MSRGVSKSEVYIRGSGRVKTSRHIGPGAKATSTVGKTKAQRKRRVPVGFQLPVLLLTPLLVLALLSPLGAGAAARDATLDPGLSRIAAQLAGVESAQAYCDGNGWGTWGQARPDLGQIWIDRGLCARLQRFRDGERPAAGCLVFKRCPASRLALAALVLTHESIHLAPDYDEAHTECMAIQRVDETLALLGEPSSLYAAALTVYALRWHQVFVNEISWVTGTRAYYSPLCKAGAEWDLTPGDGRWP